MRTNIVIDPDLLDAAMKAGPYKTKKDAVEAGLKLLVRNAAYREILKWKGKLTSWEGEPWDDLGPDPVPEASTTALTAALTVEEPKKGYRRGRG